MRMNLRHTRHLQRGLTMLEMIIAIAIILTIMVGVVWSFVELLDSHDRARARMEATANARAAMEVMSNEIKRAKNNGFSFLGTFKGETFSTAGDGDRIDNDEDGQVDEEILDGRTDDPWGIVNDKHAILAPPTETMYYVERPVYYREPDLGDGVIDADLGRTTATVSFDTFDVAGDPSMRHVRFYIGNDADGTPNTLMREIRGYTTPGFTPVITTGPLCYNVVNFGLLFWNSANAKDSSKNPWEMKWPPAAGGNTTPSPSTVYLILTVYADKPYSLEDVPADKPLQTVTLTTVVNVESVLASPAYLSQRTIIPPVTP